MNRLSNLAVVGVLALALGAASACVFDGGRADAYRCDDGVCPAGLQCLDGICVAAPDAGGDAPEPDAPAADAAEPDGAPPDAPPRDDGPPASDAPPQDDGPPQGDGPLQDDGAPQRDALQDDAAAQSDAAQSDAAQSDAAQSDAPPQQDASAGCVSDPLTSDAGHFTAVLTSGSWQFAPTGYSQSVSDDLHDTWVAGAGGDHVSIQVVVTPTVQGRPVFDSPTGNFASAAGVIVRASALTTDWATGYFCGVDLRGGRLLLGRMSGSYGETHGVMTILGQAAMTVSLNTQYTVRTEAQGSSITCTSGSQNVVATDAIVATGSVGLFTVGAQARFTSAYYCLP